MANANNITKLVYENVIKSHLGQIELVGLELEHASGVRAIAADTAMRERGGREHFDADLLFDAVDKLVGNDRLFESYNDPCNPNAEKEELELGQGCPFTSLDAYLDLRELFGAEWLTLTMFEYAKRLAEGELRGAGMVQATEPVRRAREEYAKASAADFERFFGHTKKRAA
ncbi:hypothetical protein ROV93_02245 [Stenotrophomonas maltophilia group sp. msm4]|uniref:hypothetical protein n=1 Tax=Stenotrophomonas maltophilia group sp. msm4 TaxID=3061100 RepID=UPI002893E003|nr:hypothetical protein [Stenotrophomonas maltophilia group sp. msm4]MDT3489016.1 hypothetical protein [Stenotrophomonas maltophilia group sp. msm4]